MVLLTYTFIVGPVDLWKIDNTDHLQGNHRAGVWHKHLLGGLKSSGYQIQHLTGRLDRHLTMWVL